MEGDAETDIINPSVEAYKAILEETDFFYQLFESSILNSGKTALVARSKNIQTYAAAFIEAAKKDIPDSVETTHVGKLFILVNESTIAGD